MQKLQNLTLLTLKTDNIFYIIDQIRVSMGTVVNQALPSLLGLEAMLTVSL